MPKYFEQLSLDRLTPANHNPIGRSEIKNCVELQKSIKRYGVLQPIIVVKNGAGFVVADGHRRIACSLRLGLSTIPALVRKEKQDDIYRESVSRRKSGREIVEIYQTNPNAVSALSKRQLDGFKKFYGEVEFYRALGKGAIISGFVRARRVDAYIGVKLVNTYTRKQPDNLVKIITWLYEHNQHGAVRRAMKQGFPPGSIWKCIKANKPLTSLIVEEQ